MTLRTECQKCGATDIRTRWVPADSDRHWTERGGRTAAEHLRRTCCRCDFAWAEPPLDAAAVESAPLPRSVECEYCEAPAVRLSLCADHFEPAMGVSLDTYLACVPAKEKP